MFERLEVFGFAVGFVVLPASEEDALPLVGEAAEYGLMALSLGFLPLVVGFGPEGLDDGLGGPFDEGLSPEFVAGVAAVDEVRLSTLFGDRGDAAVFLDFRGVCVFAPIAAKEGEQPCRECGSGSGEAGEDPGVLMGGGFCRDEVVEALDAGLDRADLGNESEDEFGIDF